ncbi:MAG: LPS biosynthesis protein [Proteobacteria bacterium]|nr:MAG: LPS biosynthesis protein [Pseudomonadota bacterium]PIE40303.1 MAG: LPS biosynthesis protein [Gammaproteobacteria bacterium]
MRSHKPPVTPSSTDAVTSGFWFWLAGCLSIMSGCVFAGEVDTRFDSGPKAYELDWHSFRQAGQGREKTGIFRSGDKLFRPDNSKQAAALCGGYYLAPDYLSNPPRLLIENPESIYVSADESEGDFETEAVLTGDVEIRHADFLLTGDWAMFDKIEESAHLEGNVVFRSPGFAITGDKAHYLIASEEFSLDSASYVLYESRIRGDARQVLSRKKEAGTGLWGRFTESGDGIVTSVYDGSFSTCPPGNSDWQIGAGEIELDRDEGFGSATHAVLKVRDIPVAYFPYITFPIDDRRKSGFLYPALGSSNTGRGIYLGTPFYWNIAPQADATLVPNYIHGRGVLFETEFRHLGRPGSSLLDLGYLPNDQQYKADNPGKDPDRWAFGFDSVFYQGDFQRETGILSSEVDINAVGDKDYLSELNRSLSLDEETHLQKYWSVNYRSAQYWMQGLVHAYQTIDDTVTADRRPYARLPELNFTGIYDTDYLEYGLDSRYVHFYRDNSNLTGMDRVNGQRLTLKPGISYSWRLPWAYVTPSFKLHHSDYLLSDQLPGTDRHLSRTVPVTTIDSGLWIDSDWTFQTGGWRQSIEPRLYYVYVPTKNQSKIPVFDTSLQSFDFGQLFEENRFSGDDRIADNNRLTVAISTSLRDRETGDEKALFSIGQVYHFDDREVVLEQGDSALTRSDSPLAGEIQLHPYPWIDLEFKGVWDARSKTTLEGAFNLSLHTNDYGSILNFGHRYVEGKLEQSDVSVVLPVTDRVTLMGRWLYELRDNRTIGSVAGIEYESCCWRLQFMTHSYLTEDKSVDHRFLVRVELSGLAGVDTGSLGRIEDAIEGFDLRQKSRK